MINSLTNLLAKMLNRGMYATNAAGPSYNMTTTTAQTPAHTMAEPRKDWVINHQDDWPLGEDDGYDTWVASKRKTILTDAQMELLDQLIQRMRECRND